MQLLKVPQIRRILQHVRRKRGKGLVGLSICLSPRLCRALFFCFPLASSPPPAARLFLPSCATFLRLFASRAKSHANCPARVLQSVYNTPAIWRASPLFRAPHSLPASAHLSPTGIASMNKPELLKEANEQLYSKRPASALSAGGYAAGSLGASSSARAAMSTQTSHASRLLPAVPLDLSRLLPAVSYDPHTGKFPAYEERAKRMTPNPFFVVDKTLLVTDIGLSAGPTCGYFRCTRAHVCEQMCTHARTHARTQMRTCRSRPQRLVLTLHVLCCAVCVCVCVCLSLRPSTCCAVCVSLARSLALSHTLSLSVCVCVLHVRKTSLDRDWRKELCDRNCCNRCANKGCRRIVLVRIFDYDPSLLLAQADSNLVLTETAWAMQVSGLGFRV
jgi:hypothetical protein